MAYVTTSSVARKGLVDRLVQLVAALRTALARRRTYLQTLAELNALTDRELADLGIARVSIPDIAREAAYGK